MQQRRASPDIAHRAGGYWVPPVLTVKHLGVLDRGYRVRWKSRGRPKMGLQNAHNTSIILGEILTIPHRAGVSPLGAPAFVLV